MIETGALNRRLSVGDTWNRVMTYYARLRDALSDRLAAMTMHQEVDPESLTARVRGTLERSQHLSCVSVADVFVSNSPANNQMTRSSKDPVYNRSTGQILCGERCPCPLLLHHGGLTRRTRSDSRRKALSVSRGSWRQLSRLSHVALAAEARAYHASFISQHWRTCHAKLGVSAVGARSLLDLWTCYHLNSPDTTSPKLGRV